MSLFESRVEREKFSKPCDYYKLIMQRGIVLGTKNILWFYDCYKIHMHVIINPICDANIRKRVPLQITRND